MYDLRDWFDKIQLYEKRIILYFRFPHFIFHLSEPFDFNNRQPNYLITIEFYLILHISIDNLLEHCYVVMH